MSRPWLDRYTVGTMSFTCPHGTKTKRITLVGVTVKEQKWMKTCVDCGLPVNWSGVHHHRQV